MSSPPSGDKYSVILPTYNERQNLPLIISMLDATFTAHQLLYEVVVVDDNSPDKTGDVAERLQAVLGVEKVVVLRRAGKLGLGSAYRDGLKKCSGRWIILMDADFSHHVGPQLPHTPQALASSLSLTTASSALSPSLPPSPPPCLCRLPAEVHPDVHPVSAASAHSTALRSLHCRCSRRSSVHLPCLCCGRKQRETGADIVTGSRYSPTAAQPRLCLSPHLASSSHGCRVVCCQSMAEECSGGICVAS